MSNVPDRIATTHVGSLPRSQAVTDYLFAQERQEPLDEAAFAATLAQAVNEIVERQNQSGIDIVSDGEMSKISYATYIKYRLSGFTGDSPRTPPADLEAFPSFLARQAKGGGTPTYTRPRCTGAVAYVDDLPLKADLSRFHKVLDSHKITSGFMNAPSPGVIAMFHPNEHYADMDAYLEALAEAMRPEYEAIAASGLTLQIDSPDLGLGRHMMYKDRSETEYLTCAAQHIEVLNHALRNIEAQKIRLHLCWGNYEGPHHCDIEIEALFALLMQAKPQALLFETSNPRHQHDREVFLARKADIPDDKILIPGVLDSTTNFIEHPKVVAQRLMGFADIVGRERVMAGTDCGFSTFAGFGAVDPEIVWAKLSAMAQGAALASDKLWGAK
jgi:5-methyltetrahydropteroyltriglutamate--homocysteine methyltransferase